MLNIMEEKKEKQVVNINGKNYMSNSPEVFCDYATGEYDLIINGRHAFHSGIKSKVNRSDDGKGYVEFLLNHEYTKNIELAEATGKLFKIDLRSYVNGENSIYFRSNEELTNFLQINNIVKGTINTNFYYFYREVEHMDVKMPYRKFNNIFNKLQPEDILQRSLTKTDGVDIEFHKLKSSVLKKNIKMGVDSLSHNELEGLKFTWGVELETIDGRLEEDDVVDLNVAAVHDGSLRGPNGEDPAGGEYVTGVLYGDAGFKQLYEICKVLSKKCKIDHRCGIHVHIGNLNWNNEDIVYSYLLAEILEQEIFSILPKSRRKNSYCRKLRPITLSYLDSLSRTINNKLEHNLVIDGIYKAIFKEVSGGFIPGPDLNSNHQHPKGAKCGYNKDSQRYCWLNYVTLIFNTRDNHNAKTLEFRPHGASLSYKKIKNWLKICVAFCNFVDNHKQDILNKYITKNGAKIPLNIESICQVTYPKTGKKLIEYIQERKELFKTSDESIDYPSVVHDNLSIKEVILSN